MGKSSQPHVTRLLRFTRMVWLLWATFMVAAFLYTTPTRLSQIPSLGSESQGVSQADFLVGLAQRGISPEGYIGYTRWSEVIARFIYLALGIFIFWRKPDDWMALLTSFLLIGFFSTFDLMASINPIWTRIGDIYDVMSSILLFFWFFVFPDARFVPRWTRWFFLVLLTTQVWRVFQTQAYAQNFAALIPVFFGIILIAQVYRYRHADLTQRHQIKWVVFGIAVGAAPLLIFGLFLLASSNSLPPIDLAIAVNFWGNILWQFFTFVLPFSLTLGILRSHLLDIDVVIRRTLQYTLLTALLALVYFGVVVILQGIFETLTGLADTPLITVLSTLAVAALFSPLRNRLQDFIDRRFYRSKYNAEQALAEFAAAARNEVELDRLISSLTSITQATMQPQTTSFWVKAQLGKTKKKASDWSA